MLILYHVNFKKAYGTSQRVLKVQNMNRSSNLLEPTESYSNSSNVEMAELKTKVEESMECPVRYKIVSLNIL